MEKIDWVEHVSRKSFQESMLLTAYNSLCVWEQMVPPRGCAFVSMTARKEAAKALDRMKGFKLNSSALRVSVPIGLYASDHRNEAFIELCV